MEANKTLPTRSIHLFFASVLPAQFMVFFLVFLYQRSPLVDAAHNAINSIQLADFSFWMMMWSFFCVGTKLQKFRQSNEPTTALARLKAIWVYSAITLGVFLCLSGVSLVKQATLGSALLEIGPVTILGMILFFIMIIFEIRTGRQISGGQKNQPRQTSTNPTK